MILHDKKLVFIHVPKTGGMSLSRFLEPYCDKDSLKFSPYDENGNQHARIVDYVEAYGENILENYTFFSISRNPFDRALSIALHQNNNVFDREFFKEVATCTSSLRLGIPPHSHFYFYMKKRLLGSVDVCNGRLIPVPGNEEGVMISFPPMDNIANYHWYRNKIQCPHILRFENYVSDVSSFFDRHNIKYSYDDLKKKTNATDHKHYSYYYQELEIIKIKHYCALDLQMFGYQYEDKREFKTMTREEIYK